MYRYVLVLLFICVLALYPRPTIAEVKATDYGAVCDGTTDDRAAIQSALDAANTVLLPDRTCLVIPTSGAARTLILNTNNRLIGEGAASVLKQGGSLNTAVIGIVGVNNIVLRDFTLDGAGVSGHGIRGGSNSDVLIENIEIKNVGGYGIGFQEGTITRLTVNNIFVHDSFLDGIDIKNYNSNNSEIVINNFKCDNIGQNAVSQACLDLRGWVTASNIHAKNIDGDDAGIRFRPDHETFGIGAQRSSLSNFYIECEPDTDALGLAVHGARINITNGYIYECDEGATITSPTVDLSNVIIEGASVGLYIKSTAAYTNISNSQFNNNVKGVLIAGDYVTLNNSTIYSNDSVGIDITADSTSAIVIGNIIRSNPTNSIKNGLSTLSTTNLGF